MRVVVQIPGSELEDGIDREFAYTWDAVPRVGDDLTWDGTDFTVRSVNWDLDDNAIWVTVK